MVQSNPNFSAIVFARAGHTALSSTVCMGFPASQLPALASAAGRHGHHTLPTERTSPAMRASAPPRRAAAQRSPRQAPLGRPVETSPEEPPQPQQPPPQPGGQPLKCLASLAALLTIATLQAASLPADPLGKLVASGGNVSIPAGIYDVGSISVPAGTHLNFSPKAILRVIPSRTTGGAVFTLAGDDIIIENATFDLSRLDTDHSGGQVTSLFKAAGCKGLRFVGLNVLPPSKRSQTAPPAHSGARKALRVVSLEDCQDVEVAHCRATHIGSLVYAAWCRNLSVHDNSVHWASHITRFDYGEYLRHYSNCSSHVTFQCNWWGGDANDVHSWVPDNTSRIVKRGIRPGQKGFNPNIAGAYDILVQNNYAEYGTCLAWGSKARQVLIAGNDARFMSDMSYDSEGDENVVFANNISVNAKTAAIGCYFWTDKILITGNMLLVTAEGEDRYHGNFIRLHSGGQRGPDHFGTGKCFITGNLLACQLPPTTADKPAVRNLSIEACREIGIIANRFVNARIATLPWETSRELTIADNEFDFTAPGDYDAVRLVAKETRAVVRNNVIRRTVPSPTGASGVAIRCLVSPDARHVIWGNLVDGFQYAVALSARPGAKNARAIVFNNLVSGLLVADTGANAIGVHARNNFTLDNASPVGFVYRRLEPPK